MSVLVVMVGVSYSGKSFVADQYAHYYNAQIFSSDAIREELFGDAGDQSDNTRVFNTLHARLRTHLEHGGNAIYDATNLNQAKRRAVIREFGYIKGMTFICVVVAAPLHVMKERYDQRERKVPWDAVMNQLKRFQPPARFEGWDEIRVVNSGGFVKYQQVMQEHINDSHDSPWHKETIVQHCYNVQGEYAKLRPLDTFGQTVAWYHDLGKLYTKVKGEDGVAHYYGHAGVGAYLVLTQEGLDGRAIDAAQIIAWHMCAFDNPTKALQHVDEENTERLYLLHIADERGREDNH